MNAPFRLFLILAFCSVPTLCSSSEPELQSMTLMDCIQQAIEQNLRLRIERYGPLVAQNNLSLARAGYDPTLDFSGSHGFNRTLGGLNQQQLEIPASETYSDSFSADIRGLLPWGMTYDLSGKARTSDGQRGRDFGTNVIIQPVNSAEGSIQGTLTQPILKNSWIDETRLNVSVSKHELGRSKEYYRREAIRIVTDVENAYYDLVSARENLKVQEKGLELARRLLAESRKRVEVGAMAPLEEKQAEAEVAAREADVLAAQQVLDLDENALKRLITDDYGHWHGAEIVPEDVLSAVPEVFDLQDSWDKGLTMNPEIIRAWLLMEQRGIQLKYSKNQLYPQLDVVATYGLSASRGPEFSDMFTELESGDQPFWSAGAIFSIPIGNTGARARHRNARAQLETSILEMKDLEQEVMAQIDDAIKFAKVSYRRVDATRAAREFAEDALAAEEEKLANGQSTSFEVLRLQRDLIDARSTEISALTEYNKALAALAQREGSTLQRHRIELEAD